jgi:transposase InsO family protein
MFFYLYAIIDIYSRKIVGFEVYEVELSENLKSVLSKAISKLKGIKPKTRSSGTYALRPKRSMLGTGTRFISFGSNFVRPPA